MKLLLLEDDESTRNHVMNSLSAAGHVVDSTDDVREAIQLALNNEYAVLILDRMVQKGDGLAALRTLREKGVATPTILLTAMDRIGDRIEGLEGGADDYLVKPFAVSELAARIVALARRPPRLDTPTVLEIGDLQFDLIRRSVFRAGRRIDLQAQEMKILEYLMRHEGQIVTRTMLLENVWSIHFDPQTNLIESHMSRLRAKVDRGFDSELIHTIRGAGYRMEVL